MPLNPTRLGDAIATALAALNPNVQPADLAKMKLVWEAVATEIVAEFTTNAVVDTDDTGTVTSGVGAGGTVIATGVGTIS
jgi:hypothetical protein